MFEGLRVFLSRERRTRFQILRVSGDEALIAQIETSSDQALRDGLRALQELDPYREGTFVREIAARRWRKAGSRKRRRARPRKKPPAR
jgi:hypothetical protein